LASCRPQLFTTECDRRNMLLTVVARSVNNICGVTPESNRRLASFLSQWWYSCLLCTIMLGPLNVRLSRPKPNFIEPLMQFLKKNRESCTRECYNEVSLYQLPPSAFICHQSRGFSRRGIELNIFCHDSCFNENYQYQIQGHY